MNNHEKIQEAAAIDFQNKIDAELTKPEDKKPTIKGIKIVFGNHPRIAEIEKALSVVVRDFQIYQSNTQAVKLEINDRQYIIEETETEWRLTPRTQNGVLVKYDFQNQIAIPKM